MSQDSPAGRAPNPASSWYRLWPVLAAAVIWLVFITHPNQWNLAIWPQSLARYGVNFADMQGHLAASRALADGTLVAGQPVPGDPLHRVHAGPTWMLWLGWLGLGREHYLPFTALCLAAFLATVALSLRPASFAESGYLLAALVAPPVLLLVERGNIDLLVFVALAGAFALLAASATVVRWSGWALIAAFIGFKYYPAAAFAGLVVARAGRREKITALALGLAAVAAFLVRYRSEILYVTTQQVENRFYPFFGSRELLVMAGCGYLQAMWLGAAIWALLSACLAILLGPLGADAAEFDARRIGFAGGASILVFCFLATSSPDYRLVFFLFCVPWLWALRRRARRGCGEHRIALACLALALAVPWWGTLFARVAVALNSTVLWWAVLVLKQLGWWSLMIGLGALLFWMLAASGRDLLVAPARQ